MYVIVKTINAGPVETSIVIAAYENFLSIRQVAEPVQEIYRLCLATGHSEVAGMNHHISLG